MIVDAPKTAVGKTTSSLTHERIYFSVSKREREKLFNRNSNRAENEKKEKKTVEERISERE